MGRLDVAAISLAMLAAVIGLSGLGSFLVRGAAHAAASEDLMTIAPDLVRQLSLADMLLRDNRFEGARRSIVAGELGRDRAGGTSAGDVTDAEAEVIARKVDRKEGNGESEFQRDCFAAFGSL